MLFRDNILSLAASSDSPSVMDAKKNKNRPQQQQQQQQHDDKINNKNPRSVWYRTFVKPFIHNRIPYRDIFQRRVVHAMGIPVAELQGLHAFFVPGYRHYSPLQGMIFTYNNFVNNLYRFGDEKEEGRAIALIHELFHILPGGEIQPTHATRNAGSHLTAGLIGDLLEKCEHLRSVIPKNDPVAAQQRLSSAFSHLISRHPDYRHNTQRLEEDVGKATQSLKELEEKENKAAPVRQRIKELEGDVIKSNRHEIKRLQKEQKTANEQRQGEIAKYKQENEQAEQQLKDLRVQVVTSLDFKVARKELKRAQDAVTLELNDRVSLANAISKSLCAYEMNLVWDNEDGPTTTTTTTTTTMPKFSTTAILLAYLWRKYDSIGAFKGYMQAMSRMGALNAPLDTVFETMDANAGQSTTKGTASISSHDTGTPAWSNTPTSKGSETWSCRHRCRPSRRWTATDIEAAATITTSASSLGGRPSIIQFSYVTWAAYSEFPDCAENAIRNLLHQMIFNPDTGKFDHQVLAELKEHVYPEMSDELISFYRRNANPQDAPSNKASLEWIGVVSKLNTLRGWTKDHEMFIRYRREKEEQNIASPLRNALKVFNALFGVVTMSGPELVCDIVDHINEIWDSDLEVDLSGVKQNGFGSLAFSDGKARYFMEAYKPVHFGFRQENGRADSLSRAERCDFRAFLRLKRHSDNVHLRPGPMTDSEYFCQLALSSLFVPYRLRRNKTVGQFFKNQPALALLFADLDSETQKQEALEWAKSIQDEKTNNLVSHISSYVEPTFVPAKGVNQPERV